MSNTGPADTPGSPRQAAGFPAAGEHGSETLTRHGDALVRVVTQPYFMPWESDAGEGRWVFGYRVHIRNEGSATVQLIGRHWLIRDAEGETHEVRGEGVVGRQPRLDPEDTFTYESYCPLGSPWGTMEGGYAFELGEGPDVGEPFEVRVDRFFLVSEPTDD